MALSSLFRREGGHNGQVHCLQRRLCAVGLGTGVAPNGDYVSFCTIWIDERNKYGKFEPVGTHAEYQGMGLAGFVDGRVQTYGVDEVNLIFTQLRQQNVVENHGPPHRVM
jgi:hypothetical protein